MTLDTTTLLLLGVVLLAAVAFGVWAVRYRKSRKLEKSFGPEYQHELEVAESRSKAEDELAARRKRVKEYELRELDPVEKEELSKRWHDVQSRFVDQPSESLQEAEALIDDAMRRRGYPLGELQRKEADLSVHYPREVQDYRKAHAIAQRSRSGQASTEELREATLYYRALFEHLAGVDHEDHESREQELQLAETA